MPRSLSLSSHIVWIVSGGGPWRAQAVACPHTLETASSFQSAGCKNEYLQSHPSIRMSTTLRLPQGGSITQSLKACAVLPYAPSFVTSGTTDSAVAGRRIGGAVESDQLHRLLLLRCMRATQRIKPP
jgi:hypothetical protein